MEYITIEISDELKMKMDKYPSIDWNMVAIQAFRKKIAEKK